LQAFAQSTGGIDLARLSGAGTGPLAGSAVTPPAGSGFTPLDAHGAIDWRFALPRLAGSALVVPLAEELFWRSLVMRWIDSPRFLERSATAVSTRALALQALLFGLEHDLWLAGIVAGLAYGLLYRYSGRLWPVALAHAVTNGVLGVWVLATSNWTYW
ncbi:MAG: CAAX prenyl protease-related protein, partial [Pseudomonadota bacterium]|nr:CAAX prenyl protease-related protein [Pseudomonadota bacterium]